MPKECVGFPSTLVCCSDPVIYDTAARSTVPDHARSGVMFILRILRPHGWHCIAQHSVFSEWHGVSLDTTGLSNSIFKVRHWVLAIYGDGMTSLFPGRYTSLLALHSVTGRQSKALARHLDCPYCILPSILSLFPSGHYRHNIHPLLFRSGEQGMFLRQKPQAAPTLEGGFSGGQWIAPATSLDDGGSNQLPEIWQHNYH